MEDGRHGGKKANCFKETGPETICSRIAHNANHALFYIWNPSVMAGLALLCSSFHARASGYELFSKSRSGTARTANEI